MSADIARARPWTQEMVIVQPGRVPAVPRAIYGTVGRRQCARAAARLRGTRS